MVKKDGLHRHHIIVNEAESEWDPDNIPEVLHQYSVAMIEAAQKATAVTVSPSTLDLMKEEIEEQKKIVESPKCLHSVLSFS